MIKELVEIKSSSIISQGTEKEIKSISGVKFDSEQIGSGNFGTIHEVFEISGLQTSDYVVKIFKRSEDSSEAYETIKLLHTKLKQEQKEKPTSIYQNYPGLLGLPFAIFHAKDSIENEQVFALLMFNLNKVGYLDYDQDNRKGFSFNDLELAVRFLPGYQMARTIAFLHRLHFIHADISESALWFHPEKLQLALIDFDSGYHYDKQSKASTLGKLSQWATAKMKSIIRFGRGSELTSEDRIAEEYWIFACALFEILFGRPPFYFLIDGEENTITKYLKSNSWPYINTEDEAINRNNISAHQEILKLIKTYEENDLTQLINFFKVTFNEGHSKIKKRVTVQQWEKSLGEIVEGLELIPAITTYYSDRQVITKRKESVSLAWECELADYVTINDRVMPLFSNSTLLSLDDTSDLTLKAINSISQTSKSLIVKAKRIQPIFKSLIPSQIIRTNEDPITISWDTDFAYKVLVEGIKTEYSGKDQINVHPIQKTTYKIIAFGNFDQTEEKTITVDVILPTIKDFDWKIDINKGIDNINIFWKTKNTVSCQINPLINEVAPTGQTDIKISERTEFELVACGLYGQTKRRIQANPFCAPIIETIFTEAPSIEISTKIDVSPLRLKIRIPEILMDNSHLNIEFSIQTIINPELSFPNFTINNLGISPELNTTWFSRNYEKTKKRIMKKITKINFSLL